MGTMLIFHRSMFTTRARATCPKNFGILKPVIIDPISKINKYGVDLVHRDQSKNRSKNSGSDW